MAGEQLCFFKFARPLEERLGKDFFKSVPKAPGVYIFTAANNRVLYVGQSQNLRVRLAYYKNAQPEREPRKIIRMLHRTEKISYQTCDSPEQAQLRENELIRELRPLCNVANAKSVIYSYFAVNQASGQLELSLHIDPREDGQNWYGAFKARGLCRQTLFSLGRWLWKGEGKCTATVYDFPIRLGNCRSNVVQIAPQKRSRFEQLNSFLDGESSLLLETFQGELDELSDSFTRKVLENDLQTLTTFYESGPVRTRAIRENFGLPTLVPKNKLDDYLLLLRRSKKANASPPPVHPSPEPSSTLPESE